MKIKINQTIHVDADAWANEYGVDKKDVRADVQAYFANWLQQHLEGLGLDEVRPDDEDTGCRMCEPNFKCPWCFNRPLPY